MVNAAVSTDAGNTAVLGTDALIYVPSDLPPGGTAGQALIKSTDVDFETEWSTESEIFIGADEPVPRGRYVLWIDTDASGVVPAGMRLIAQGSAVKSAETPIPASSGGTTLTNVYLTPTTATEIPDDSQFLLVEFSWTAKAATVAAGIWYVKVNGIQISDAIPYNTLDGTVRNFSGAWLVGADAAKAGPITVLPFWTADNSAGGGDLTVSGLTATWSALA